MSRIPPSPFTFANAPVLVDRKRLEQMAAGGSLEIDAFLLPEIRQLKSEYLKIGNPYLLYLAYRSLSGLVSTFIGSRASIQYARLQLMMAEMLLAQGKDSPSLNLAIFYSELAIETLKNVESISDNLIQTMAYSALMLGVAKKALGHYDDSLKNMRSIATYLTRKRSASKLDLIPLSRQEIIMQQTDKGHVQLLGDAIQYKMFKPCEYYSSLKRVFEYLLNKGRVNEAGQLFPELKRAFLFIKHQLAPISVISYLKNVGQYSLVIGDSGAASKLYETALSEARRLNLYGQVRQLTQLIQELKTGRSQSNLVTFKV